jgi:hypothetical protein
MTCQSAGAQAIKIKVQAPWKGTTKCSRGSISSYGMQMHAGMTFPYMAAGLHMATLKEHWLVIIGDAEAARSVLVDILKDADKRGICTDRARRGAQQASDEGQPALPVSESDTDEDNLEDNLKAAQQDWISNNLKEGSNKPPKPAAGQHWKASSLQATAIRVNLEQPTEGVEELYGLQAESASPDDIPDRIPPDEI